MVSPGKPSPGRSVPPLRTEQVEKLGARHRLVDPTHYMYGRLHHPNQQEIDAQNPQKTERLLAAASWVTRMRSITRAYGVEHIPERGVFICAASHVTQMDVFVPMQTLFHLGRRPRFMAKAEMLKWPFVGKALQTVGMQPVERRSGKAKSIEEESVTILCSGRPLTIFPEGTVTRDPKKWPMSLKPGLAIIALKASRRLGYQVPIFPAVTWGGASINNWWPWPRKNIVIGIGSAVDYSDLLADSATWQGDGEPGKAAVAELSERVRRQMEAIMSEIRGEEPPVAGMWDYRTARRVPRPQLHLPPTQYDPDDTREIHLGGHWSLTEAAQQTGESVR